MKVYIDSDFKCHTTNPDGVFREIYTDFFNDKCRIFIEGYHYVPAGELWTKPDGVVLIGETLVPCRPYQVLDAAQREYERQQLSEVNAKLNDLTSSYQEGINSI